MFRFTIRDLLWLMAVVGLSLGWAVDHWRKNSEIEELAGDSLHWEFNAGTLILHLNETEPDWRERVKLKKKGED